MLYEIRCDKFMSHGQPRGPILFHKGLNVVRGHDSGTNSIGKSTFLLIVDFAFGGETYATDDGIKEEVTPHTIKFCFLFDGEKHYFSRCTATPNEVNICDENYAVKDTISLSEYCQRLFNFYHIDLPLISFRKVVGRYFRVYGRHSTDENNVLAAYLNERQQDSLKDFLKLFNLYEQIDESFQKYDFEKKRKEAIANANKYEVVQVISKKQYDDNLKEIEKLKLKLQELKINGNKEMLYVETENSKAAADCEAQYTELERKKRSLWARYYSIKNSLQKIQPATERDFSALLRYFPNSDINELRKIEQFHYELNVILTEEFKMSMHEILCEINDITAKLQELQVQMEQYDLPKRISDETISECVRIQGLITKLENQNEFYITKKTVDASVKELKNDYNKEFVDAYASVCQRVNSKMEELNAFIYGESRIAPKLIVKKSYNSYQFGSIKDNGTGTKNKDLILFDLTSLMLTPLPTLAHDTILFHHIEHDAMAKILELYQNCDKQVFIAIDEGTKYNSTAQKIITENTVIELSGNGNELFGRSWNIKNNETEQI